MTTPLQIPDKGAIDFLSLGALIHRFDPGTVPFRKAKTCAVHVSGGEFNCAANLSDCFGLRTAVATAMVDYPVGDLIAGQVRAWRSTIRSISGPTASRIARTTASALRTDWRPSIGSVRGTAMNLIAV